MYIYSSFTLYLLLEDLMHFKYFTNNKSSKTYIRTKYFFDSVRRYATYRIKIILNIYEVLSNHIN